MSSFHLTGDKSTIDELNSVAHNPNRRKSIGEIGNEIEARKRQESGDEAKPANMTESERMRARNHRRHRTQSVENLIIGVVDGVKYIFRGLTGGGRDESKSTAGNESTRSSSVDSTAHGHGHAHRRDDAYDDIEAAQPKEEKAPLHKK